MKIIDIIKKIFSKKKFTKQLASQNTVVNVQDEKCELDYFEKYRKDLTVVNTMVCDGDGLGIQTKFDH